MAGISEEDSPDEMDKGPIVYQESKVFHMEPCIISVYDNTVKRFCTFEVYGLDTQNMVTMVYKYTDFDGLFRFNAELMNPNRKEGRFHWVIVRLEIAKAGGNPKLVLASEPTSEVPELPNYETHRKIPTGRMDLKERQRLREQMDMLNIKRDENISKKRAAAKQKFLKRLFGQKEEAARKAQAVEEMLEAEREERYNFKEEIEKQEAENARKLAEKQKQRVANVEVKEERTEEAEEEDLRLLRIRWKENDRRKAEAIKEAHERKEEELALRAQAEVNELNQQAEKQSKREGVWKGRDVRIKRKQTQLIDKILSLIPERQRDKKAQLERNQEFVKDLFHKRQPIFEAQLARSQARVKEREAENAQVAKYVDTRALAKKVKTKGKHSVRSKSPQAKKKGKKTEKSAEDASADDGDKASKAKANALDSERMVDAVEIKMRREMEEHSRRGKLQDHREAAIVKKAAVTLTKEIKHDVAYKEQWRQEQTALRKQADERRIVQQARDDEKLKAAERKKMEKERLNAVRAAAIERMETRRLNASAAA